MSNNVTVTNPWRVLRRYTDARIGLGRCGTSLPTQHHLAFQLDHARARDAVLKPLEWRALQRQLSALGPPLLQLHSCARDREQYLQRPDLGRLLDETSVQELSRWRQAHAKPIEICIVVADGLSATAIASQALPMLQQLLADAAAWGYSCDLICCAAQGRVALGDDIAERLNAKFLVMLIGERPGLSAADSLGIYFTYLARKGCSDADRNCLSNIRPQGLPFTAASERLLWLIKQSERRQLSGYKLKDESESELTLNDVSARNFLLPRT